MSWRALCLARLSTAWKQPVVVDNKPGASGAIAAAELARSPKDGYTLMAAVGTNTSILKVLKPNLPFDPVASVAPVSRIATFPSILVVRPDLPAADFAQLVALVKANPGKYTFASAGYGSPLHLAGELFKIATGTDVLHVPFTGSAPAVAALLGGHVDMSFDIMPSIWSSVQAGKLRALGAGERRADAARAGSLPPVEVCPSSRSHVMGRASWHQPAHLTRSSPRSRGRSAPSLPIRRSLRACATWAQ